MLCRSIIFFSCICVAAAIGGNYSDPDTTTDCQQQVPANLTVETAAAAAVMAVKLSCDSLRQAALAFLRAHLVQVLATQGWADAVRSRPEEVVAVSRLLAQPPAETSEAATGDARNTTAASRPHGNHGNHSDHSQTPVTDATATSPCPSLPPDDVTVILLRRLSEKERRRRLTEAAKKGDVEEARALLAAQTDVRERDQDFYNRTALHWAANGGHAEVLGLLLRAGAQAAAGDNWQFTPLHLAALNGGVAAVRLLLAASADPNARDEYGSTPLHWATYNGKAEAAAALLEAGADKRVRDDKGRSPLDVAKEYRWKTLTDLLS